MLLYFYIFICSVIIFFSGCQTKHNNIGEDFILKKAAIFERYIIGKSRENRPVEIFVIGNGDDVILILGSIHGDEIVGTSLLYNLLYYLQSNPGILEGRKVILLPEANPDGVIAVTRDNARNIDLNRNFPATNCPNIQCSGKYGLPEPETDVIIQIIESFQPDRIISIHEPLDCIDYDGPAEELAKYIAKHINLPVRKLGAKPGSLGSYAGEDMGIPVVTLELPESINEFPVEHLWQLYRDALVASIVFPDFVGEYVTNQKFKETIY